MFSCARAIAAVKKKQIRAKIVFIILFSLITSFVYTNKCELRLWKLFYAETCLIETLNNNKKIQYKNQ